MMLLAPWLLVGLAALPVIWWLLHALPHAPRPQSFPPASLLRALDATPPDTNAAPLWRLILRCLAMGLLVLGLAQPVFPRGQTGLADTDCLIVVDNGWAAAATWPARLHALDGLLDHLARTGHGARLLLTAPDDALTPVSVQPVRQAQVLRGMLDPLLPRAWPVDRMAATQALGQLARQGWHGPVIYVSDGLATPADGGFATALAAIGPVHEMQVPDSDITLLAPLADGSNGLATRLHAVPRSHPRTWQIRLETATGGTLGLLPVTLAAGQEQADVTPQLPAELRNRVDHLSLDGMTGPAGIRLLDERERQRPVGLIANAASDTPLMGSLFYLRRALQPVAELREGDLDALLARPLSVIIAPDGTLGSPDSRRKVDAWVRAGGTLIRFAGPLLIQGPDAPGQDQAHADTLLPVPLMGGERVLGGTMSWSRPEHLAPFPASSPFHDLDIPADVTVSRQVLAQPSTDLDSHSWARLTDGTPLVTHAALGAGQVVLFHVTSTAEWSNLPLSGLFVSMLEHLIDQASGIETPAGAMPLAPYMVLDGDGALVAPPAGAQALRADAFGRTAPSATHPPGLYGPRNSRRALNPGDGAPALAAQAPVGTVSDLRGQVADIAIGPLLLLLAALALLADGAISVAQRGRRRGRGLAVGLVLACALATPARADDIPPDVPRAALETRLAYIVTGHEEIDDVSREGLQGLSDYVNARTSAVLGHPDGVVPERDDLSYYPLIYWPVTADATTTPARTAALNTYMRHGGILLIDAQGQDPATAPENASGYTGSAPGTAAALRRMTAGLDIPPLARLDNRHVLAHTFYLLHDFPGRYDGMPVWVAQEGDSTNDGVSPVIIGSNDWAHAWAVDDTGNTPYAPVPDGAAQRVLAYRFGVNAVIYALTGNYKADQVHVPALLKRLGE
ncbi:hypothetical protein CFR78_03155 [Komagataeibacter rhaeticus]|uniref:DUF4159 domain-containing protein n=2 Tax=Komagataeibacter rhaeticus TaxID=215221 RepID=UPI0004D6C81E|nr:DUF4159 domain-containing protein [Komagataeibacter rhaeticus]KDU95759.1 hypothetical protein GLUCORHAEAF1_06585 [Komagataeibacter rhaeticus AF1]MBL7239995.1 DUF4159 domain-containing protein [Komagataeibacter rhaeticus]PYD54626.1 hypothetical protein CFR78_03155 [Komagataeibacter rhaeticus]